MPAWKVLLIGLLASICLVLGLATVVVPLSHEGNERWLLLLGLLVATLVAGSLLGLFLRQASKTIDSKTRGRRY